MTMQEVIGFGRPKEHVEIYRGAEYQVGFLPKIKLELVVADGRVEEAISIIIRYVKTDKNGDRKIFILPVAEAIRVRTEETGEEAL